MTALVTIDYPPDASADAGEAPTAGPHGEGHTVFSLRRQADFLAALQLNGNVRQACRAARVSAQTAYRQRRASPALAHAWDAACLAARDHAEQALADRALNGVEEAVFYHGEEVARRRRYDTRLLLAHLARLDRLAERAEVAAALPQLDAVIDALRAGIPAEEALADNLSQDPVPPVPSCGAGAGASQHASNTGAPPSEPPASPAPAAPPPEPACDCVGARHGTDAGAAHYRMSARGPEPVVNCAGEGPCCDDPCWPDCRGCPHYPPVGRILGEMADERPADAPPLRELGDPALVDEVQIEAFCAGVDAWWLIGSEDALAAALDALEGEGDALKQRSGRAEDNTLKQRERR